eukprot:1131281-Rhodomonas_salina.2
MCIRDSPYRAGRAVMAAPEVFEVNCGGGSASGVWVDRHTSDASLAHSSTRDLSKLAPSQVQHVEFCLGRVRTNGRISLLGPTTASFRVPSPTQGASGRIRIGANQGRAGPARTAPTVTVTTRCRAVTVTPQPEHRAAESEQ